MRSPIVVILVVVLILLFLPTWPYSTAWGLGWYPSGALILVLIILILLTL